MKQELLSISDVAKRLGRDFKTIKQAVLTGDIYSIKLGKRYYVPVSTLDKMLAGK